MVRDNMIISGSHLVMGLGFGDEGKGLVTNSLATQLNNSIVCRYSCGQQSRDTVVLDDGTCHTFSNFGSGSLQGRPTYLSKYCAVDLLSIYNESQLLGRKGYSSQLFIDKRCPVITLYDKVKSTINSRHLNTVVNDLGVETTIQRERDHYHLTINDLYYKHIAINKLKLIAEHHNLDSSKAYEIWEELSDILISDLNIRTTDDPTNLYGSVIFEGSQGLMLDQNIGFFPHVTKANTGSKNPLEMGYQPHLWAVTRCYQTRYDNGPMTNMKFNLSIAQNPNEVDTDNEYQGKFRKSVLDLDTLEYALHKDGYAPSLPKGRKTLVVTCCDQIVDNCFQYTYGNKLFLRSTQESFLQAVGDILGFDHVIGVNSPSEVVEL